MDFFKSVLLFTHIAVALHLQTFTNTKCPRNYPYAFKNGAHCCSTNEENPRGGSYEEIVSGTCDGVGFDIMSTCCKNYDSIKCPGDSCIDNKEG